MTLSAWLEPRVDPGETLASGCMERPAIHISTNKASPPLALGRGNHTAIADLGIGENLIDISFCEAPNRELALKATPLVSFDKARIHINGRPLQLPPGQSSYLYSGDILSLDNLRYEYKVHINHSGSPKESPLKRPAILEYTTHQPAAAKKLKTDKSAALPAISETSSLEQFDCFSVSSPMMSPLSLPNDEERPKGITLNSETVTRLSDEIQCCICLEIQVHPRTLNPCGHTFCLTCVGKLQQCPQCREGIRSHAPARMLDNLISTLVSVPNMLPEDDVTQYNERKAKTAAKIAAVRKRLPIAKRQRSDVTSYSSGATVPTFPSNPSIGSTRHFFPPSINWAGSSSSSAVELNRASSGHSHFALSQSASTGRLPGAAGILASMHTDAQRRFRTQAEVGQRLRAQQAEVERRFRMHQADIQSEGVRQGTTIADAICIDD